VLAPSASRTAAAPAQAQACELTLDDIAKRYDKGAYAVDHVTLEIRAGELISLLGPSGCGKTTLLRIIAGFVPQNGGKVVIDGKVVDHLPPEQREVGIVFQNYALFPHMTVADNVAYGLAARGMPRAEQKARVDEMLSLVQLGHLAQRYPKQLSGGQQQRVALARALAVRPRILLLDEPFAALDKNLRLDMQIEIKRIQRLAGITAILVTHDQEEALSMSDRIAVLNHGRVEQFGTPSEVYDTPASLFVNQFVGTANMLSGSLQAYRGNIAEFATASGEMLLGCVAQAAVPVAAGSEVLACIRPESLTFTDDADGLGGTVELGMPMGALVVHEVRLADGTALKIAQPRRPGMMPRPAGTAVRLKPASPSAVRIFRAPD
jgi:putative spermidine/putrescine transport system ATP-binding protein